MSVNELSVSKFNYAIQFNKYLSNVSLKLLSNYLTILNKNFIGGKIHRTIFDSLKIMKTSKNIISNAFCDYKIYFKFKSLIAIN